MVKDIHETSGWGLWETRSERGLYLSDRAPVGCGLGSSFAVAMNTNS
jgi:hypothetical protein